MIFFFDRIDVDLFSYTFLRERFYRSVLSKADRFDLFMNISRVLTDRLGYIAGAIVKERTYSPPPFPPLLPPPTLDVLSV